MEAHWVPQKSDSKLIKMIKKTQVSLKKVFSKVHEKIKKYHTKIINEGIISWDTDATFQPLLQPYARIASNPIYNWCQYNWFMYAV